jgi:hypothetical protein
MNKNKILKNLGNAAVILSLAFVCKKIAGLNIERAALFNTDKLISVAWISFLYGLHMFALCVPWMAFLRILTGRKIPFSVAAWIVNKSNLMKYLPGNVFQFIGRNELAVRLNLSHADVAFATVCDLGLLVAASLLAAVFLDWRGIMWLGQYGVRGFRFLSIGFAAAGAFIVFLAMRRENILRRLGAKARNFFTLRSLGIICACLLYFLALALLVAALFLAVLTEILRVDAAYRAIPSVLSAYMLSWVAGFITPGAPGGIGIREAVLTLLLTDIVPMDSALLAAVIFRLISIVGDLWGLSFAWVGLAISRENAFRKGLG